LEERDRLLAQLPVADQAHLTSRLGQDSYANTSADDLRGRLALLLEAPTLGLTNTARRRRAVMVTMLATALGERSVWEEAIAQVERALLEMPSPLEPNEYICFNMGFQIDGRLDRAKTSADQLVESLQTLGLPEANVYRTTTSLAIQRERGGLAHMGGLAAATAALGHPAGPARAISAFIRLHEGHVDPVLVALDEIEDQEFADDAGFPVVLGYWSEIVAALGTERQRRRFLELLTPRAGLNLCTGGIYLGPIDRLAALLHDALGEHERADELFSAAVQQQIRIASPPWTARTQLDWAESLLARNEFGRAGECVAGAVAAVGELDLPDARSRIASISARLGRPAAPASHSADAQLWSGPQDADWGSPQ
jgi:hypothetical protein